MALGLESTMKLSSPGIKAAVLTGIVLVGPRLAAQSEAGAPTVPRDYSFTISTAQSWTDTGVDLQAGDLLAITAGPHGGDGCDPRGAGGSAPAAAGLPVSAAPGGALIAKLADRGEGVLVGSSHQVRVAEPGHLFFGVNGGLNGQAAPSCSGFAVKVHLTAAGAAPASSAPGGALPTPSSSTSSSSPSA
jgi:hypothetical protein